MPGQLKDIEASARIFLGRKLYPPKGHIGGYHRTK
jgi:hypothetical protein